MDIPYGALPFSYGITGILKTPGLTIKKEGFKDYNTKGELLGNYQEGNNVLIIEDTTVIAHTVIANESIFQEDRTDSIKLVQLIVSSTLQDYEIIIK